MQLGATLRAKYDQLDPGKKNGAWNMSVAVGRCTVFVEGVWGCIASDADCGKAVVGNLYSYQEGVQIGDEVTHAVCLDKGPHYQSRCPSGMQDILRPGARIRVERLTG